MNRAAGEQVLGDADEGEVAKHDADQQLAEDGRLAEALDHAGEAGGQQDDGPQQPRGDLAAAAVALAGQSLWQILPLTPPGAGHSPYQSPSAFAGSPWLVDLDDLVACGWLAPLPDAGFDTRHCDFARVIPYRLRALRAAWQGFSEHAGEPEKAALADFTHHHSEWLDDYALFMVLQARHGPDWPDWPPALAHRDPRALQSVRDETVGELGFWHFVQWRFHVQWQRLREEAHSRGIHIVGDVPIFVAHQSADVWAHADQFLLDAQGLPDVVAGVPPDYFSATGQRWGNPLYRWDRMALDDYRWWKQRLAHPRGGTGVPALVGRSSSRFGKSSGPCPSLPRTSASSPRT